MMFDADLTDVEILNRRNSNTSFKVTIDGNLTESELIEDENNEGLFVMLKIAIIEHYLFVRLGLK